MVVWKVIYHFVLEKDALKIKVADFLYFFLEQDFPSVWWWLASAKSGWSDEQENWHEGKENIRAAVAGSFNFLSLLLIRFLRVTL